jgi:hypothetical protein
VVTFGDDTRLLMFALSGTTLEAIRKFSIATFGLQGDFTLKYKYKEHLITMACLSFILVIILLSYSIFRAQMKM